MTSSERQKTIYDMYGFPKDLYQVQYNANGDLNLAKRIQALLPEAKLDDSWGLDHGTWSILKHIYPKCDIPVLQISLDKNKTRQQHYETAKSLRQLRDEGVLVMGSGNVVHNLGKVRGGEPYQWAAEFNNVIKTALLSHNDEVIVNYLKVPGARESVPTTEHYLPIIYVAGLQDEGDMAQCFAEGLEMGSLSMMSAIVRQSL